MSQKELGGYPIKQFLHYHHDLWLRGFKFKQVGGTYTWERRFLAGRITEHVQINLGNAILIVTLKIGYKPIQTTINMAMTHFNFDDQAIRFLWVLYEKDYQTKRVVTVTVKKDGLAEMSIGVVKK